MLYIQTGTNDPSSWLFGSCSICERLFLHSKYCDEGDFTWLDKDAICLARVFDR